MTGQQTHEWYAALINIRPDGTATQHAWTISREQAGDVLDLLGEPNAEAIISPEALQDIACLRRHAPIALLHRESSQ